ncbi:MAG: aminotransferase class III-fold pyridoxal phosphate-dependent enzyme [Mucinivorans sp.]
MKMFDVYPLYDVTIERALGSELWDEKGQRYLDMYGGHAVISIGHTNARYVKALTDQLGKIGFYSNSVMIPQQRAFADALAKLTGKNDYQLFLCNSGAEANENALKLASFHTLRKKVVAFSGSFHGRTSLAVAATDNPAIVAPVNETENVIFSKFNDIEALTALFAEHGSQIAAVITEGIQGVGGIQEASREFLVAIRELCTQYGALYVADSVQCGCGRSGQYFSHDWAGVQADIYTMAKGIANGFPMGAILIAPHIAPKYGMLGTTFGGNHLAAVAARAVAQEMLEENLMDNASTMGQYLFDGLKELQSQYPQKIKYVRGRGLMLGFELFAPSAPLRGKLLSEHHIFVGTAANKCVVRLLPALTLSKQHCNEFLSALRQVLSEDDI